eukprot:scpid43544/ scgid2289/ 
MWRHTIAHTPDSDHTSAVSVLLPSHAVMNLQGTLVAILVYAHTLAMCVIEASLAQTICSATREHTPERSRTRVPNAPGHSPARTSCPGTRLCTSVTATRYQPNRMSELSYATGPMALNSFLNHFSSILDNLNEIYLQQHSMICSSDTCLMLVQLMSHHNSLDVHSLPA